MLLRKRYGFQQVLWTICEIYTYPLLSCRMETTEIQQNISIYKYIDLRHLWVAAGVGFNS